MKSLVTKMKRSPSSKARLGTIILQLNSTVQTVPTLWVEEWTLHRILYGYQELWMEGNSWECQKDLSIVQLNSLKAQGSLLHLLRIPQQHLYERDIRQVVQLLQLVHCLLPFALLIRFLQYILVHLCIVYMDNNNNKLERVEAGPKE